MSTQKPTRLCGCGRTVRVIPTSSPWEFDVHCECGNWEEISWFHGAPAPSFTPTEMQLPLIEMEHL